MTTSTNLRRPLSATRRRPALPWRPAAARSARARRAAAVLVLLAVTLAWGSSFFLIKDVVTRVPVTDFLALRFAIAALALWLLSPRSVLRLSPPARTQALALGIVYAGGQLLQTWGLQHTSASVSGFVTGMYVVLTPLLGALILRHSIGSSVWAAAFLATAGLGVLSLQGLAIGVGEAVTLLSAGFYALHILGLGAWSAGRDAMGLAVVQMVTVALVCFVASLPGGIVLPSTGGDWTALLYMALVAGAFAIVGQTWGQAHLPAARAAVVMTMEPVWAGGFAVAFGGEGVTTRLLLGGALVLAAMFLAEFGPRRKEDQDVAREIGGVPHVGPV